MKAYYTIGRLVYIPTPWDRSKERLSPGSRFAAAVLRLRPARALFTVLWRGYLYSLSILGELLQTACVPKTARVYRQPCIVNETPRASPHTLTFPPVRADRLQLQKNGESRFSPITIKKYDYGGRTCASGAMWASATYAIGKTEQYRLVEKKEENRRRGREGGRTDRGEIETEEQNE